ncbi:hypothetical protein MKX03_025643 [Papaver bracteatum]|nr:hypothetical protein MKX03_025643 [Papaver bracteatum]
MYLVDQFFDTRSFPMDRPTPSSSVFCLDVCNFKTWERLTPMVSTRGSFACIGNSKCESMFGNAGIRLNSVECYNIVKYGLGRRERRKLGNVVVVDGGENDNMPILFMLDWNDIFRYDNSSNRGERV